MSTKYIPAIAGTSEIRPELPLHDPNLGWINAHYLDGSWRDIDLKTAILDAHLIKSVSLDHTVATATLHRIIISIVSSFYIDGINSPRSEWREQRLDLLDENMGFDPRLVHEYFAKWEDRFYLIHSHYPFLQDPSLAQTFDAKTLLSLEDPQNIPKIRAGLSKNGILGPISASLQEGITPNSPNAIEWQLPKEDSITDSTSEISRIKLVFEALTFGRYASSSTNRGSRLFLDVHEAVAKREEENALLVSQGMAPIKGDPRVNDTHVSAQSIRVAINYIVDAGSLFKTIILAMSNEDSDLITDNDIPEWEWAVNEYGFLGTRGKSVDWHEQMSSTSSIRSSINNSHLACLFVPTLNEATGESSATTSNIRTLRRVLFNFKHLTTVDSKGKVVKMPFPMSWNPFIAITKDNKAFKQISPLSRETALSRGSLMSVALLPKIDDLRRPRPLLDLTDQEFSEVLEAGGGASIRVLVCAGDAGQSKEFNDFTLTSPDFSHQYNNPVALGHLEDWVNFPTSTGATGIGPLLALRYAIRNAHTAPSGMSVSDKVKFTKYEDVFWTEYTRLFNQSATHDSIIPVTELGQELIGLIQRIFNSAVSGLEISSPFMVAKARNRLDSQLYSRFKKGL